MYVPFFCCESFPYISRRAWFPCALFPLLPPALPLFSFLSLACPFQFPFVSLSCPAAFLSCRLPISCPHFTCTSLHFPSAPQYFQQKTRFSSVFTIRTSKNTEFSRFSAKGGRNPKPAKSRQGESSLGPLFCDTAPRRLRLVERHQIAARSLGGGGPPPPRIRRRAGGGG